MTSAMDSVFSVFIPPRTFFLVIFLITLASQMLRAEPIVNPAEISKFNAKKPIDESVIYLHGNDGFIPLEKRMYIDDSGNLSPYIRSFRNGRFLEENEKSRVIPVDYFNRIRGSDPILASMESVYKLDRSSDYVLYTDPLEAKRQDRFSRIIKISLLALVALSYASVENSASRLEKRFAGINDGNAKRAFLNSQFLYYTSLTATLGFFAYDGFLAYNRFGKRNGIDDLRIRERRELPPDTLFVPNNNSRVNDTLNVFPPICMRWTWRLSF